MFYNSPVSSKALLLYFFSRESISIDLEFDLLILILFLCFYLLRSINLFNEF